MQRFFTWLGTRLFSEPSEEDMYDTNPRLRIVPPAPVTAPVVAVENATRREPDLESPTMVEFESDLGGRVEDAGPGKNVLIRNKYIREDTGTHETLKIIDDSMIDTGEEAGFDPYNTGQFDRSRNWRARTRK